MPTATFGVVTENEVTMIGVLTRDSDKKPFERMRLLWDQGNHTPQRHPHTHLAHLCTRWNRNSLWGVVDNIVLAKILDVDLRLGTPGTTKGRRSSEVVRVCYFSTGACCCEVSLDCNGRSPKSLKLESPTGLEAEAGIFKLDLKPKARSPKAELEV